MRHLVQDFPWASTPLGPIESWSTTLVGLVNLALNSPVASAVYWGTELIMIYNDAYRDNIGPKHPEALGAPAREVWKEFQGRFGDQFEAILADGQSWTEEKICLVSQVAARSVETFWDVTLSPIYEDGMIAGIFKTNENVTAEVATNHALAENEERFRMALSAGDCIAFWEWDLIRKRVFVEGQSVDFGKKAQGLPFEKFLLLVHPEDRAGMQAAIAEAIRSGADCHQECRLQLPDGSTRWAMSRGRCLYGEHGEPMRFTGITFDLSAQKDAERSTALGLAHRSTPVMEAPSVKIPLAPGSTSAGRQATSPPSSKAIATIPKMVISLVKKLATDKDAVALKTSGDCDSTNLLLTLASDDFRSIFLGDDLFFKSIQTLLNAASIKLSHRFTLKVSDMNGSAIPLSNGTIH